MKPDHIRQSGDAPLRVQAESRFCISSEGAMVHAARLSAGQQRALHTTIHESKQSTRAIAEKAGISYSFLANCANESLREQLPFPRLPLVLEQSDDLTLVRFLADLQHASVVRLPTQGAEGDIRKASVTMREFAQFMEVGAAAVEDNVVSPEEFARVEREGREAVQAILELVAHYRSRVTRPLLGDV